MKLSRLFLVSGIVVVAGLAFMMISKKAPEKEAAISDEKQIKSL